MSPDEFESKFWQAYKDACKNNHAKFSKTFEQINKQVDADNPYQVGQNVGKWFETSVYLQHEILKEFFFDKSDH